MPGSESEEVWLLLRLFAGAMFCNSQGSGTNSKDLREFLRLPLRIPMKYKSGTLDAFAIKLPLSRHTD